MSLVGVFGFIGALAQAKRLSIENGLGPTLLIDLNLKV
jgi:hypothetical protein